MGRGGEGIDTHTRAHARRRSSEAEGGRDRAGGAVCVFFWSSQNRDQFGATE